MRRTRIPMLLLFLVLGVLVWAHPSAEGRPTATKIDAYFSPKGGALKAISKEIRGARKTIDAGLYLITHSQLATDLIAAHKRGVEVRVVLDGPMNKRFSKIGELVKHEVRVWRVFLEKGTDDFSTPQYHHKFAVIDGKTVITGSFNWTKMAEESNHENLLVIRSEDLAKEYTEVFESALEIGVRADAE